MIPEFTNPLCPECEGAGFFETEHDAVLACLECANDLCEMCEMSTYGDYDSECEYPCHCEERIDLFNSAPKSSPGLFKRISREATFCSHGCTREYFASSSLFPSKDLINSQTFLDDLELLKSTLYHIPADHRSVPFLQSLTLEIFNCFKRELREMESYGEKTLLMVIPATEFSRE